MRFLCTVTARALVWLAAAMIPWQGLPGMACACAMGRPRPTAVSHLSPATQHALGAGGECRRCPRQAQAESSCCKRIRATAQAVSDSRPSRCACDRSCTCCGPCLCRKDRPTAPPLPAPAGSDAGKSFSTSPDSVAVAPLDLREATVPGRGPWPFSPSVPTSLERLSTLCRFLI